ncbi:7588_t:CDS:2, partial [Gigaspora margarita]
KKNEKTKDQTRPIQKNFRKFYEAKEIFELAEKEYNEKLNEIFKIACASDDHETAFNCESDLENSIVLNVNLDALKKSASSVFQVQCTSIQEFNE